jgi:hypothetical protein
LKQPISYSKLGNNQVFASKKRSIVSANPARRPPPAIINDKTRQTIGFNSNNTTTYQKKEKKISFVDMKADDMSSK